MSIHEPLRSIRPGVTRPTALALALCAALALFPPTPVTAQPPNKDTAKNRQDSNWGTRKSESAPYFEEGGNGTSWGVIPKEKHEQRDPYEDIIITVDPNVSWPPSGNKTVTTTTTHTSDNATVDSNSTDTTTTTKTW